MTIPKALERHVFEIPQFADAAFCEDIIARAHLQGFEAATIVSEQGTARAPDIRNNDRVIFDDAGLAQMLWAKIAPVFERPFKGAQAVGVNERFRVYRYVPGQFFDWHLDGTYTRPDGARSIFTFMIYLNGVEQGGGTRFADVLSPHIFADFTIDPAPGKALLFHHPLSHRGDPVERGVKYVLRSDVMFEG